MSMDRRKKQEKRAREKQKEKERLRGLQARVAARTHVCEDCGDDYREDRPTSLHRLGRCEASKEKIDAMTAESNGLDVRWEKAEADSAWVNADGVSLLSRHLPCLFCGRTITRDEESWFTCEGEFLWTGCDHCESAFEGACEQRLVEIRLSWPEVREKIQEIENHIQAEAKKRHDRFVAPFTKPVAKPLEADASCEQPVPWPTVETPK